MKILLVSGLNFLDDHPESLGDAVDMGFIVYVLICDFLLLLSYGNVYVAGRMPYLILHLSIILFIQQSPKSL